MTFFISIRYLLEFFFFKIIIFLLFPFSKKMSSRIISNSFMILGKLSKYNQIAKKNCKMVFPNLNEKEITKIINNSWQNLGHNLFELTFLKRILKDKNKIEIKGLEVLKQIRKENLPVIFCNSFANVILSPATNGVPLKSFAETSSSTSFGFHSCPHSGQISRG